MKLYQDRLIILDYDPSTDVLSVDWPSVGAYDLSEVERSLNILVECIRSYDVKLLLIDSTRTTISPDLDMARYQTVVTEFAHKLQQTRLRKSARIMHADLVRESTSQKISEDITRKAGLVVENRNFAGRAEALAWLTS
jgi:archaellum biogenesis ATPase FlaH